MPRQHYPWKLFESMIIITSKENFSPCLWQTWVRQQYSSCPISLWIFIPHPPLSVFLFLFLSLSFSCLHRQISSCVCFRSRGLAGVSAGTHLMGDTVETFPNTVSSDDSQRYRHAASPLRCSPLGSLRKRLGLFKCQFIFFAHYRECAPCSASREKSLVRGQFNLGWQIKSYFRAPWERRAGFIRVFLSPTSLSAVTSVSPQPLTLRQLGIIKSAEVSLSCFSSCTRFGCIFNRNADK